MSESRLKESASAVKKLFGTAAQLAQKQAALATLNNVTLPKIYHAIGKKIVGLDKLPSDLGSHRERIRALEARIAARPDEPTAAPTEGFAAKAKHLAQQAAQKASKASTDAAATMQIHAAYVSLGKAAVEKYGDRCIPNDVLPQLKTAFATAAQLTGDIEAIKLSGQRGWLSPSRLLATCGIASALLVGALLLRSRTSSVSEGRHNNAAIESRKPESAMASSGSSAGGLPPGWKKPVESPEWEQATTIDVATASQAVEAANDIYTPPEDLVFGRLERLTPEVAQILAKCRYSLAFLKIKRLTPETAAALAQHQGGVSDLGTDSDALELTGLQDLPADVAAALASRKSGALRLGSIRTPLPTLTADAAQALSRYQGREMWICVKELSAAARTALQSYPGTLRLDESAQK